MSVWPTDTPPRLKKRTHEGNEEEGTLRVAPITIICDRRRRLRVTRDVTSSVFSISCVHVYVPIIITDRAVCVHAHSAPVVIRSVQFLLRTDSEPYPPPRANGKSTGKIPKTSPSHPLCLP